MPDEPNPLREWATAERLAVQAEELVRSALRAHVELGAPLPTQLMQENATALREHADALFRAIRTRNARPDAA